MSPTMNGRNGVFVMLSSAHAKWSYFQEVVEKNMRMDIEDHENLGTKLITSGSDETRNLCFNGRRLFIQHWEQMIKYNNLYAMSVQRALMAVDNNRDEEEFATQYDNRFLAQKTSSFFDIPSLKKNDRTFQNYSVQEYINNNRYCVVGAVDFAISGDISDFTIKAIPNGWGTNRESILLYKYVMNPTKDKGADSIPNQLERIFKYVQLYNISAIVFDETGIGKSAPEQFKELLRRRHYTALPEHHVFGVEFKANNRTKILENYWSRIQSGLEILPEIPKDWEDEDKLKKLYVNHVDKIDESSCYIRHIYEHMMFNRTEIKNDKGEVAIDYRQTNYKWLHDDSVFSSALCSYILQLKPDVNSICNVVTNKRFSTAKVNRYRWRR